ncbi:hypothetical protein DSO57_1032220 [Entomophthora muscae]|uniref:Uncharacterized protein n=1 Tax=Entomophthora muscae TaxID=34485 RepID=A0ACC2TZ18_9FUNG|nr:hypothetical protein DSO57_1032220 [Entomophthora muscae]
MDKTMLSNTLRQVQTYIDKRVAAMAVVPPTPSPEGLTQYEAKICEALMDLKTTFCQTSASNPPAVKPVLDPCIIILNDQVAILQCVRKRPDTSCITEMLRENSSVLHNPNAILMTLLAALDNELWLLKVWPPAKLPNQCKMTKICN